ncbi:MAG: NUDIX hydrolase N-terminal domain-containing protein [Pseudomonadota bacterium]
MEDLWLGRVKRLGALASTGVHFGASEFDKERYAEVGEIALAMLADLADRPIRSLSGIMSNYGESYATPMIDVRGAVFRDGRILLVHEKMDGLWTLPGGYADVGRSAAENVVKEVVEEAGIRVRASRLVAVRHKAKHAYAQDARDFYKFLFLCEMDAAGEPAPGPETLAAQFFALDELPPLSTGRTIAQDVELCEACLADPRWHTVFD